MVAKIWGLASTATGALASSWGKAAAAKVTGRVHSEKTTRSNSAPIKHRADLSRHALLAGITNVLPLTSSVLRFLYRDASAERNL
jgi:hypothetical protein